MTQLLNLKSLKGAVTSSSRRPNVLPGTVCNDCWPLSESITSPNTYVLLGTRTVRVRTFNMWAHFTRRRL